MNKTQTIDVCKTSGRPIDVIYMVRDLVLSTSPSMLEDMFGNICPVLSISPDNFKSKLNSTTITPEDALGVMSQIFNTNDWIKFVSREDIRSFCMNTITTVTKLRNEELRSVWKSEIKDKFTEKQANGFISLITETAPDMVTPITPLFNYGAGTFTMEVQPNVWVVANLYQTRVVYTDEITMYDLNKITSPMRYEEFCMTTKEVIPTLVCMGVDKELL